RVPDTAERRIVAGGFSGVGGGERVRVRRINRERFALARLSLLKSEKTAEQIPIVCMVCGRSADTYVCQRFTWKPGWVALFALVGHVAEAVVESANLRRMTIDAPVCGVHRRYWSIRGWGFGVVYLFAILGFIAVVIMFSKTDWEPYVVLGYMI